MDKNIDKKFQISFNIGMRKLKEGQVMRIERLLNH